MAGNAHSGCSSTSPGLGTSPCTSRRARNGGSSPRPPTRRRRAGPPSRRPAAMETVCRPLCGCERGNVPGGFPYPQKQKFPPPRSLIPVVDSPKPDSLRMKSPTDQICAGSETPKLKIKKKKCLVLAKCKCCGFLATFPLPHKAETAQVFCQFEGVRTQDLASSDPVRFRAFLPRVLAWSKRTSTRGQTAEILKAGQNQQ